DQVKAMKPTERADTLARHNLYVSKMEMDRTRRAVLEGTIWELAEGRCRAHPAILDGLRRLKDHTEYLEKFEPLSRDGAVFYTGPETLNRPVMMRFDRRAKERYSMPDTEVMIVFEGGEKPYSRHYQSAVDRILGVADSHFYVMSEFGPVPLELDEIYPIAQSLFPKQMDRDMVERIKGQMEDLAHRQSYKMSCMWDGDSTMDILKALSKGKGGFRLDQARIRAVAEYQFGIGAADALFRGSVELVKSRNTDKIRNVLVDGEHVVSMRAEDGFFSLRPPGARRLMQAFAGQKLRVTVHSDAVPFNREGKNVMCSFILDCDEELRPGDEAIVVDQNDSLIAIGKLILTKAEAMTFKKGIAVKVREGIKL
ncbi:MAG TPA: PUA domain-containing protein, partial [Methanomassiliicoccales archaeon]|nr:PUA domain-containing protein [Methanomassiliicoccales archaeon]